MHASSNAPSLQNVTGIPFTVTERREAINLVLRAIGGSQKGIGAGRHVHFVNSWLAVLASRDERLFEVLNEPNAIVMPDGWPIAKILQWRHPGVMRHVRGPQFFEDLVGAGRGQGLRHFLLGSSPAVLRQLEHEVQRRFAGVSIAGSYSPSYRPADDTFLMECLEACKSAAADVVWLGVSSPKQDLVASFLARELGLTVCCVGAAFDFTAKTKRAAPTWVSRYGGEWLFRFATEPRRLWRRYLIGIPQFTCLLGRYAAVAVRAKRERLRPSA
jgi:N-acetylglucosaminyldiphosphoundecaprenol N-acetyl-beta-D-mannosaminyltransferase